MKRAPSSHASQETRRDSHESSASHNMESAAHSVLGPTVVLRGELTFEEPLIIKGEIHGSATGTSSVVVEPTAKLKGQLSAGLIQFRKGTLLNSVVLTGRIQQLPGK